MDDAKLRSECVRALEGAGFGPVRAPFSDEPMWSTFFSDRQSVSNPDDEREVRAAMYKLLADARDKFSKAEAALASVFQ
jgi:hypothetical protein